MNGELDSILNDIDISDTRAFHQWVTRQINTDESPSTLFATFYEAHSDVALLRAFNIAHWFLGRDKTVEVAKHCERAADRRVELCARGYLLYLEIANQGFTDKQFVEKYTFFIDMLRGELSELLSRYKDDLTREAEIYLRHALAAAYLYTRKYNEANEQITRCKYIAESLGAIYYTGRVNSLLIASNYEMGRVSEALAVSSLEQENPHNSRAISLFHEINTIAFLFLLGHNRRPLDLLTKMMERLQGHEEKNYSSFCLYSRYRTILGIDTFCRPEDALQKLTNQSKTSIAIAEAMTSIIKALGIRRETKQLKLRHSLLEQAGSIWQEKRFVSLGKSEVNERWIKAYANYKQGAYIKAWSTIRPVSLETHDWLGTRTLYAGLKLELAMCLWFDESDIQQAEQNLRSVFERAAQLPHASEEGLAQRLMHWFPLASAYGALMPNPIHHLQPALAAILKVGSKNSVHDIDLSPSITAEFILKALDYDLRPGDFQQFDTPANRKIRDSLMSTYGEVPYYLPYISAISLALGLKTAGHHKRARNVSLEYGIVPQKIQSSYKMRPVLEELRAAMQALLDDEMTPQMFCDVVKMTTLENSPLGV